MNTGKLLRHLLAHGCHLSRNGRSHDIWRNADDSASAAVPRHRETKSVMVKTICRDLGIPIPREK